MENSTLVESQVKKVQVTKKKKKLKNGIEPYLYLLPSLILFGMFMYYPFIKTIYMSMGISDAHGRLQQFIGIQNYTELLSSPEFRNSIAVSIKFVFMTAIPAIIIGLILALLANVKLRGSNIYKLMFSMPMAVSSASAAIIWMIIFHPSIGLLNHLLRTNIGWLIDPKWALFSVSFVTAWLSLGVNFIFILSGLKNVPQELIESASIDGAGYFRKLFKIVIPMISPTLFFVFFVDMMAAFQAFGQVNIMTSGGPGNSTNVLVYSIYREAFFNGRFDTACTQSILLFLIMLVISLIQFKYEKKGVYYS